MKRMSWREASVHGIIVTLLAGRLLTEDLGVLPRFFNAIDIVAVPLLLPFCVIWVFQKQNGRIRGRAVTMAIALFTLVWALAWLFNIREVHWLGGLLFLAGLLVPVLLFLVVTNFGLDGQSARRMLRVLESLLLINLVIGTFELLLAVLSGRGGADTVFGTFGQNQNQLAYFFATMIAYRLGQWRYDAMGPYRMLTLVWTGIIFLFCGFQTLWVVVPVALVLTLWMCGRISGRTIVTTALVTLFVVAVEPMAESTGWFFSVSAKFAEAREDFDDLGKVELLRNIPRVWALRPWAIVTGLGPGTFNSRAFRNIAILPYGLTLSATTAPGAQDVAAAIVSPFYTSEMSARFIVPYFEKGKFYLSGSNTDGPFTSYVSVPMEAGVPGALLLFGLYGMVMFSMARSLSMHGMSTQVRVYAAWALMNLLMLLGIACVDNYLETTRYTVLAWLSVAIWKIEMEGRRGAHVGSLGRTGGRG